MSGECKWEMPECTVNLFSSLTRLRERGWGRGRTLEHEVYSRVFPLPSPLPQVGEGTGQLGSFNEKAVDVVSPSINSGEPCEPHQAHPPPNLHDLFSGEG